MYRKFTADRIFNGYDFIPGQPVLITDEAGMVLDCMPGEDAGDNIAFLPGTLTPGFINGHCHVELSHLKGIIEPRTGLVEFVQQVMQKRAATPEEKTVAMASALDELYASGTVAIADICNTADTIALKQQSRFVWRNFIEAMGFIDATAEKRFAEAAELALRFERELGTSNAFVAPHAPYSVSASLFRLINENTAGKPVSIHNQETEAENQFFLGKHGGFLSLYENLGIDISGFGATGKSSMQSWLPFFYRGQKIISVHNTCTHEEDIFMQQEHAGALRGFYYCLCPGANMYIENRLPPADLLWNRGCSIIIGTDSYASNTSLNMYHEVKMLQSGFPAIPEAVVLQWATINGAEALGIDSTYGSFEKGKRPGIVQLHEGIANRIL